MTIRCEMRKDCVEPVTHIGAKGYVYCQEHARARQGWERCRKMAAWELRLIREGSPLPSYCPIRKPAVRISYRCRDIGYGVEAGECYGRWAGERDTSGKRPFQPSTGKTLYLFDDEVLDERRIA